MKTIETRQTSEGIYEGSHYDGDAGGALDDEDTLREYDELAASVDSTTEEVYIRVHRLPLDENGIPSSNSGVQLYLFSAPVGLYKYDNLIEKIKKHYMTGEERIIAVRIACYQTGKRGARFNRIVRIQKEVNLTPMVQPAGDSAVLQAIQAMMRQNADLMRVMMERREAVPAPDPVDQLGKLTGALAPMLTVMAGRPIAEAAPQKSFVDQLIELKKVKEVMGGMFDDAPTAAPGSDGDSTAEILRALGPYVPLLLRVLQGATRTPGVPVVDPLSFTPPADQTVRASDTALPSVQIPSDSMEQFTSPPAMAAKPSGPRFEWPTTAASPATPAETSIVSTEEIQMLNVLRPQLETLTQMAAEGANPVEVAQLTLEQLPESPDVDAQLYRLISDPKCLNKLALIQPLVNQHRAWFEQLIQALLAEFEEDTDGHDS